MYVTSISEAFAFLPPLWHSVGYGANLWGWQSFCAGVPLVSAWSGVFSQAMVRDWWPLERQGISLS